MNKVLLGATIFAAGAFAAEKLPVTEEQSVNQTIALANISPDVLLAYVQNKELDEAGRKQLERIADQKRLIAENDGAIRRAEEQINELVRDQERIRQNIYSLNQVSGQQEQVQNYARRLAGQETQLASLRDRRAELKRTKTALEEGLNKLIESMEF
jgi:chromosome segregation ATPase